MKAGVFRKGKGEPLVLIHMGANPWHKWEPVLGDLTDDFDVLIPTLPGWKGGAPIAGEASVGLFVDKMEAAMDDAGFATAHIAGNSLGGWLAFELARRGRARSVCAFSPGGGWDERGARRQANFFRMNHRMTMISRPLVGLLMRFAALRVAFFEIMLAHPRRMTPKQASDLARDSMLGQIPKIIRGVLLDHVVAFPDAAIPALIAWGGADRFTRLDPDAQTWRAAAPWADFTVIPDVGHLAMYDNPQAVAELIRDYARRALPGAPEPH